MFGSDIDSQFTTAPRLTLDELIAMDSSNAPMVPVSSRQSTPATIEASPLDRHWENFSEEEGQLAIDVYETEESLIVVSAIAGIKTADLDLSLQQDMLTIRGRRTAPIETAIADSLISECYWGGFSRTIILPSSIDPQRTSARMTSGVLVITLPKLTSTGTIPVIETDEDEIEEGVFQQE